MAGLKIRRDAGVWRLAFGIPEDSSGLAHRLSFERRALVFVGYQLSNLFFQISVDASSVFVLPDVDYS
jgi:hypothetical protein